MPVAVIAAHATVRFLRARVELRPGQKAAFVDDLVDHRARLRWQVLHGET